MSRAQNDAIRSMLAARPPAPPDMAARRAGFEALAARFALPGDVGRAGRTLRDAPALDALWLTPPGVRAGRVLLYLHGGAFVVGSPQSHAELCARLARHAGTAALSVGYRLAPEHRYPAALDDALAAYRSLLDGGIEPRHIAVAGDSAGGNLAAALLLRARADGLPMPAALALLSPYLDLTHSGQSVRDRAARDPFIEPSGMEATARTYLGAHPPADPLASPLWADLSGLPPCFVQVGEDEVLYDDSARFCARAREAGVPAVLDAWPEMFHVFPFFAQMLDEGAQAAARMGAFLRDQLG